LILRRSIVASITRQVLTVQYMIAVDEAVSGQAPAQVRLLRRYTLFQRQREASSYHNIVLTLAFPS
jgi:hypothetical protein